MAPENHVDNYIVILDSEAGDWFENVTLNIPVNKTVKNPKS